MLDTYYGSLLVVCDFVLQSARSQGLSVTGWVIGRAIPWLGAENQRMGGGVSIYIRLCES